MYRRIIIISMFFCFCISSSFGQSNPNDNGDFCEYCGTYWNKFDTIYGKDFAHILVSMSLSEDSTYYFEFG